MERHCLLYMNCAPFQKSRMPGAHSSIAGSFLNALKSDFTS